jgi:formate hydrogenlyase transcriptional activator
VRSDSVNRHWNICCTGHGVWNCGGTVAVIDSIDAAATFELAIEAAPSGIVVSRRDGTIVLVNRELERQFGYARDELIGRSLGMLVPDWLPAGHWAQCEKCAPSPDAGKSELARELTGRRKDGSSMLIEIGLNPVDTADNPMVLASIVDITERRRLERLHRCAVDEQLGFERLVAELSGTFINHPPAEMQDGIREALRRISTAFGVDRSTFHRIGPDGDLRGSVCGAAPDVPPLDAEGAGRDRLPWTMQQLRAGRIVSFATLGQVPSEIDRGEYRASGTRSSFMVPLSVAGRVAGAVRFDSVQAERTWPPELTGRLTVIAGVFGQVLARQRSDEAVRAALAEVERLKDELQAENKSLREAREWVGSTHVVGQSAAVRGVMEQIQQVAATDSTVLLLGETGTGKELFARQIHELGTRRSRPLVTVNCAAIPATLIESELFGREKGAYTGALARQAGRFELADRSTIFLDEIGDLPGEVQVKLLRVLEERQVERLGSPKPISVDARIIAATHQNLEQRIADGAFREDLFYRINVFPIRVPPLRERVEDIPQMVWRFVEEFSNAFGKRIDTIAKESVLALQQYSWPGNVRELRNVVERAMIVATGPRLTITLPLASNAVSRRSPRLVDVEKEHVRSVLEGSRWRIRGAGGAAERLGLKPTTLETRMAKLGLKRPNHL